jgi:hypothetical protein
LFSLQNFVSLNRQRPDQKQNFGILYLYAED